MRAPFVMTGLLAGLLAVQALTAGAKDATPKDATPPRRRQRQRRRPAISDCVEDVSKSSPTRPSPQTENALPALRYPARCRVVLDTYKHPEVCALVGPRGLIAPPGDPIDTRGGRGRRGEGRKPKSGRQEPESKNSESKPAEPKTPAKSPDRRRADEEVEAGRQSNCRIIPVPVTDWNSSEFLRRP